MGRPAGLWVAAALALTVGACSAGRMADRGPAAACLQTTIAALVADPARYEGRRVCVSGFLGRMPLYGETNPELFETRQQAETIFADHYLDLGVRLDIQAQARLARYSTEPARVEGIFTHDPRCRPEQGRQDPPFSCFPPRPMRISRLRIQFEDGARF